MELLQNSSLQRLDHITSRNRENEVVVLWIFCDWKTENRKALSERAWEKKELFYRIVQK